MVPRWLLGALERAKALFAHRLFESELGEEIQFHIDEATTRYIGEGMSPRDARRAAVRDFGGVEKVKEEVRSATGVRLVQDVVVDLKYALRRLTSQPAFSGVVILTIAVCIAANGAVFSLVNSVLLRPLDFPESDRLVSVYNSYAGAGTTRGRNSAPDLYDRREFVSALDDVALYTGTTYSFGGPEANQRIPALVVSPSFFSVLNVSPHLGRTFSTTTGGPADAREAVITFPLWQTAYGGMPDAVGKSAILEGEAFTIVGVLPESFRLPSREADVFTPLIFSASERSDAARHRDWYEMIGRLAPGASVEDAQAQIDALNSGLMAQYPPELRAEMTAARFHTAVRPYLSDLTRGVRKHLLLLWAGVLLVLAIGVGNLASLLLIRAHSRSDEIALRASLGASRSRILRQLVTESTALALIGAFLGLALAHWSLGFLRLFERYDIPRLDSVGIDPAVIGWSLGVAIAIGAVSGAGPAIALLRGKAASIFDGFRRSMAGGTSRTHQALVAGQVAVAFILLMGTGLLVMTLRNLNAVDPGFDPEGVGVAVVSLPDAMYPDENARLEMTLRILESLRGLPGIHSVAVSDQIPFSGGNRVQIVPSGSGPATGEATGTPYQSVVSSDYFDVLSIDVVSGRGFRAGDDRTYPRVAIVDETLAERLWPEGDAVGQELWRGKPGDPQDPSKALTVVGVVEAVKQNSLMEGDPVGAYYVPLTQVPLGYYRIVLNSAGGPEGPWPMVQDRLKSLDPNMNLASTAALEETLMASLFLQRAPMQVLSVFALIGLFLGAIGVYGVMAFSVATRTREIGIRVALGSSRRAIASLFGRECWKMIGFGVTFGLLGSAALTRYIGGLLYGTEPLAPAVMATALTIIVVAAATASFLPVRRAMRVDPVVALKSQ